MTLTTAEITVDAAKAAYKAVGAQPIHGCWFQAAPGPYRCDPLAAIAIHEMGKTAFDIAEGGAGMLTTHAVAKTLGLTPDWVSGWGFGFDDAIGGYRIERKPGRTSDDFREGYLEGNAFGLAWKSR